MAKTKSKKPDSPKARKPDHLSGTITQIIGPVVDVEFANGKLPNIYDALEVKSPDNLKTRQPDSLVLEVQQHLGDNLVRAIALSSTNGLKRGTAATNTLAPISVPVGIETLGRIFNVTGQTIDGKGQVHAKKYYPIHRPSPTLVEQETGSFGNRN